MVEAIMAVWLCTPQCWFLAQQGPPASGYTGVSVTVGTVYLATKRRSGWACIGNIFLVVPG